MSLSPSCMAAVESALGYSSPKNKEKDTKVLKLELVKGGGVSPQQVLRLFGIPYISSSWEVYKPSSQEELARGADPLLRASWVNQGIVFERITTKTGPVKVDELHILIPACKLESFTFVFRFCLNNIQAYNKVLCAQKLVFKNVSKGNDPREYSDQWELAVDGDYCKLII